MPTGQSDILNKLRAIPGVTAAGFQRAVTDSNQDMLGAFGHVSPNEKGGF